MLKPGNYLCKNSDCPNYKENKLVTIGSGEKHACPLQLPNCESECLEPAGQQPGKFAKVWRVLALVALLAAILGSAFLLLHPKPRPDDVVIVSDGGVLLNALLVNIPSWTADTVPAKNNSRLLRFGLWGCRPREQDGERRVLIRNYTSGLLPLAQFQALKVPAAPPPNDLTEQQRKSEEVAYDVMGDVKQAIDGTQWSSKARRHLVIVTASSGYPPDNAGNTGKLSPAALRELASKNDVDVFAIHVLLPYPELQDDQRKAEAQLKELCGGTGQDRYFTVSADASASDKSKVSSYEVGFKQSLSEILNRIAR